MKIAYLTIDSAEDTNAWSGLNRSIADCLRAQGCDLTLIGPLYEPRRAFVSKVRSRLSQLASRRRHLWTRQLPLLRYYGAEAARRLAATDCDIIFSPGTEIVAYLPENVRQPIAFWTDAPVGSMIDYYPWYTGLAPSSVAAAMRTDTLALRRAALGCYSSDWAAEGAVVHHGAARERLAVVPFGPNLPSTVTENEIAALARLRLRSPWRFLFVGVDWARKGGDKAVAVVAELNRRGYPSVLDVAGCTPPGPVPDFVKLHGFVNRREASGRKLLSDLFRAATFFILPSTAEAFGVVFAEAMAHAVPCLGTRTGGIPSIVTDNVTGHLFAPESTPADWVGAILFSAQPARYEAMTRAARHDSITRLNWHASGVYLKELLERVLANRTDELHRLSSVA